MPPWNSATAWPCARKSTKRDWISSTASSPRALYTNSMKKIVASAGAPKAIGPYSQAVVYNGLAYLSGQIPLDPATGQIVEGDIAAQTERVLDNLKAVLEACG